MESLTVLATLTLPGVMRAAAYARQFLEDMLGADHPALFEIQVCANELVTNAVQHTRTGKGGHLTIVIAVGDRLVRISVIDDGAAGRPYLRDELYAETGRGMLLVERLSEEWGVDSDPATSTVWFTMAY